jgi:hypothetical protein
MNSPDFPSNTDFNANHHENDHLHPFIKLQSHHCPLAQMIVCVSQTASPPNMI